MNVVNFFSEWYHIKAALYLIISDYSIASEEYIYIIMADNHINERLWILQKHDEAINQLTKKYEKDHHVLKQLKKQLKDNERRKRQQQKYQDQIDIVKSSCFTVGSMGDNFKSDCTFYDTNKSPLSFDREVDIPPAAKTEFLDLVGSFSSHGGGGVSIMSQEIPLLFRKIASFVCILIFVFSVIYILLSYIYYHSEQRKKRMLAEEQKRMTFGIMKGLFEQQTQHNDTAAAAKQQDSIDDDIKSSEVESPK